MSTMMSVTEARAHMAETIDAVQHRGERTLLHRNGKPAAALVPVADLELLRELEDAHDLDLVKRARAEGGKRVSHADLKSELAGE